MTWNFLKSTSLRNTQEYITRFVTMSFYDIRICDIGIRVIVKCLNQSGY